jgi:hypothetical protein
LPTIFSTRAGERQKSEEQLIAMLYQQIGQLKVQVDWQAAINPGGCGHRRDALVPVDLLLASQSITGAAFY